MSITDWESKSLSDIPESSAEFAEMQREAHNGAASAQYALGMWYETHGNREEAEKWYRRAASQGHETANQHMHESW